MTRCVTGCSLLLLMFLAGCQKAVEQQKAVVQEDNQLGTIIGQLIQERPNMGTYRSVMEQLNSFYDHQGDPNQKMMAMNAAQEAVLRQMLSEVKGDFDKARRVDEVKNRLFNIAVDASYLDSCLLFREAYQSLASDLGDVPSKSNAEALSAYRRELVNNIFGWTMRQVALRKNPANIRDWPAHEILRLGAGDAEDRLRVFLGILSQSELDACALVVKTQVRQDNIVENRQIPVLAGVLLDGKLYLFDPLKGLPVPGSTPGSIATLDELKKNPALLGGRSEAVTPTQIAESELVLVSSINSLAPRMEQLEKDCEQNKVTIKLKEDAAGRIVRFKAAGLTVKAWAAPNRAGFPGLVFQKYVEGARGDPRLTDVILPRAKLVPTWALDAERQINMTGSPQSLVNEFDKLFVNVRLEPGGGRDLLVRGKPHQAVASLSRMENRLDRALDNFHKEMNYTVPRFREEFVVWLTSRANQLRKIQQSMATVTKGSAEERQLALERAEIYFQLETIWKETNIKGMLSNLGAEWAMPELREHLTYFMGLAKLELAIRAERNYRRNPKTVWPEGVPTPTEQYIAAADWFKRYEALIIPMNSSLWIDAVRERHKECDAKIAELQLITAQAK